MKQVARVELRPVVAERRAVKRPRRARALAEPSPVVKWAGGKTRLLGEIELRRPATYRRYFEPFIGGGAVFFHLAPRNAVISDLNPDLMNVYRCVAWHVEGVIRKLREYRANHDDEFYYETRQRFNDRNRRTSDVTRAAMFIYLNKTCYNGLYRVNRKGEYNVPVGRYTRPAIYDPKGLRAASEVLQRAELRTCHFAESLDDAASGDFVYLDPPYTPLSSTADFTSYTADGFNVDDQRQLASLFRALANRGCHVMLSNHDTPFIRELYDGFDIATVKCNRAINSKASSRGDVSEVLITNAG